MMLNLVLVICLRLLNRNTKIVSELSEVFTDLGVNALISSFFGRLDERILRRFMCRIISEIVFDPGHMV